MKRARLLAAVGLVAAGLVYLLIGGIRGAVVYYVTPSELLSQVPVGTQKSFRLGGQVAPGSKEWAGQTLDLQFVLTDGKASIPVHYRGAPPDLFTEGQGAIVEGVYTSAGTFEARSIIVRHSEEYRPPDPGGR